MRARFLRVLVLLTATFAAFAADVASTPVAAQTASYKAPRSPYGDKPNLDGIWQTLSTANWDLQDHVAQPPPLASLGTWGATPPGQGVVEGNEIPYKPEALKKKQENFEKRATLDPEVKCYLPGVPRAMYMPRPFQIVQTPTHILMKFEYSNTTRTIYMQKVSPPQIDTWMGRSQGRWEGDTLVVETSGLNDSTWFDHAGNFHSDELKVVERITPVTRDALMYEATIDDPKIFTRPWKISLPLYRRLEKQVQLTEFNCIPFVEELLYSHLTKKAR